jgi:HSP20 family protein
MARRSNPFEDLEELFDRMRRQFEEATGSMEDVSVESLRSGMRVDVEDAGESFVVRADLPGFEKEEIDVRLSEQRLRISAEHSEERTEAGGESDDGRYVRQERHHSSMERVVRLPEPVDETSVSAEFRNGVLTVTLAKMESDGSGRDIEIE